ncbi:hypothetical protein TNCV_2706381 [Trichonephila clavipes]|nr:hypothetical protein TNCV_2706381 [Trichonephila clavipes]
MFQDHWGKLLGEEGDISRIQMCTPTNGRERLRSALAIQGLLATDLVVLSRGQVTKTTPELAPTSPNYHITPMREHLSSRQI